MRLIWLVGASTSAKAALEQALAPDRTGLQYVVRTADLLDELPTHHFSNPGVIALLDAFAVDHKGFEGLKVLRERGFKGHVFIFGEPAPEEASHAISTLGLSGFFPPFERADWNFVGGILNSATEYDGSIDVNRFIAPGGRCASETIGSLKDFNAFSIKLAAFVGRFGVDLAKLKKVLLALSLPHVKTDSGTPTIEQPFSIFYGMDPLKIVLAAQTYSRGAGLDSVRRSYSSVVAGMKSDKPASGAMFPEFSHLTKATQNLIIYSGSPASVDPNAIDPLLMVTTVPFPPKEAPSTGIVPYFFSFIHVVPSAEIAHADHATGEDALQPVHQGGAGPAAASDSTEQSQNEVLTEQQVEDSSHLAAVLPSDDQKNSLEAGKAPEGSLLQSEDLNDLLEEPNIVGDEPLISEDVSAGSDLPMDILGGDSAVADDSNVVFLGAPSGESAGNSSELQLKLDEALAECDRLRKISEAMAADIKRLMKERRQPTTDRELRDANARMQEQVKGLTSEKLKSLELVATREKQIELMKVQIETLKKEKAA